MKNTINNENEKRTLCVIIITVLAMLVEVAYGYITNSMALLADGYHMGIHVIAFGLTYAAYVVARKLTVSGLKADIADRICTLSAFTSSLFLGITGIFIIVEAVTRFFYTLQIKFNEAILVATIGLCVNVVSVFIMNTKNLHPMKYGSKKHEDYNFKAAYFHILSDILTSVLAIVALLFGKYFDSLILDPIVGLFSGLLILRWSYGLLKSTAKQLVI